MNPSPFPPEPPPPPKSTLPEHVDTVEEEESSVIDLSEIPLEEQMKWNSDYLPENRAKLESVILNPAYRAQAAGPDRSIKRSHSEQLQLPLTYGSETPRKPNSWPLGDIAS